MRKPRVRVLVVVWGEAYIERFMSLALPALMAPGNLPALRELTDLEVVILTPATEAAAFQRYPQFHELSGICPIRFIGIEDLLASGIYGVTLTLAFMRGITDAGPKMTAIHFLFLNSDFVLADGSLRNVARAIVDGRRCIMAPSFRAVAEDVEPQLRQIISTCGGRLVMPPRDMVRLALRHVHPTTIAKTVNQGVFHSAHANQLYWSVDQNTMLARMFLIFMLCIRPERVVTTINSFCDYGFVPELCPSGDIHVMSDSDDIFMLETQSRLQEASHVRLGPMDPKEIELGLSEWTTAGHRRMGTHDLLFHCDAIPQSVDAVKREASQFVAARLAALTEPKAHAFHPYWLAAFHAWSEQRRGFGLTKEPAEAAPITARSLEKLTPATRLIRLLRPIVVGARPFVRFWHHDWADYRLANSAIEKALRGKSDKVLLVRNRQTPFEAFLAGRQGQLIPASFRHLVEQAPPAAKYGVVICVLTAQDLGEIAVGACESLVDYIDQHGELLILLHNMGIDASAEDVTSPLKSFLVQLPHNLLRDSSLRVSGGTVKLFNRHLTSALYRLYLRRGLSSLIAVVPGLLAVFLINALDNIVRATGRSTYIGGVVSSAVLRCVKR